MATIELDIEIPDLAEIEVETPDVEVTPSGGEVVVIVATPGPPGGQGPPGQGVQVFGELINGVNGIEVEFTTANPYLAGSSAVYLNGLREFQGEAYDETPDSTITFSDPPLSTDSIRIDYIIQ